MKTKICIKEKNSFFQNYVPTVLVLVILSGLALGFSGSSDTDKADSCKQQVCFKHPNGTPASGYGGSIKNSSGVTVATWTSDADGCMSFPGANLNTGESHTIYVATSECATDPVGFIACSSSPIIVTICE